jgi:hypothetical protein
MCRPVRRRGAARFEQQAEICAQPRNLPLRGEKPPFALGGAGGAIGGMQRRVGVLPWRKRLVDWKGRGVNRHGEKKGCSEQPERAAPSTRPCSWNERHQTKADRALQEKR